MSASSEDIPSLTLRVLEKIQGELVNVNTKFDRLNDKVDTLNDKVDGLNGRVDGLNERVDALNHRVDTLTHGIDKLDGRFDHFLTFSGRDVQDLKVRVTALEKLAKRRT
jgi:peptidoglycan hydrolase CwlO-like protein